MIKPHIAQQQALQQIDKSVSEGKNKFLVVMPSGIGKTYLSSFATKDLKGKILYIAHRWEILRQAEKSFKQIHNIDDENIGYCNQFKKQINKSIVFAMVQTLSKNYKDIDKNYFDYIILDEYHHSSARTYEEIINYFKPKYFLGMTATPYRGDGTDILKYVDNNVPFKMDLKEGIEKGYLVKIVYYGLKDNIDYSRLKWNGHKYTVKDLDKTLLIPKRDQHVIKDFKRLVKNKQTLGFCCSIKHAKRCVKKFNNAGIKSEIISCYTPHIERKRIINDFENKKIQAIFTKDIFNEGIDIPDIEAILLLRPTQSKTLFYQQIGRGLRKKKGKNNIFILDFRGNYVNSFRIRYWMKELLGNKEKEIKPSYTHNNIGKFYFEKELIDIFKEQESRIITEERLINEYYRLKKLLKKNPAFKDMDTYGIHSASTYGSHFGSWNGFLIKIGEKPNLIMNISKDALLKELKRIHKFIKKIPQYYDIKRHGKYSYTSYINKFGSYSNALKKIGLKYKLQRKTKNTPEIKEKMIKELQRVAKKLGKTPTAEEINKHGEYFSSTYMRFFGSWVNAIKLAGLKPRRYYKKISMNEAKKELRKLEKKLGHIPSERDNRKHGKYSSALYWKKFGSFKKAIEECL